MGLSGISIWQLLIILLIVVVIFGTKKIRHMGGDLGKGLKNFRRALDDKSDDKKEDK
jgi:sec-independent protein translocase protein TatA